MFSGFGIHVDVDAECANVVDGLSTGFLYVCLTAGAVVCCDSLSAHGSLRVNVDFTFAGFGVLKSGLTLNHVSPVHACPSSVLLACVGNKP